MARNSRSCQSMHFVSAVCALNLSSIAALLALGSPSMTEPVLLCCDRVVGGRRVALAAIVRKLASKGPNRDLEMRARRDTLNSSSEVGAAKWERCT